MRTRTAKLEVPITVVVVMATPGSQASTLLVSSEDFYGDSDADENPFEHDEASAHGGVISNDYIPAAVIHVDNDSRNNNPFAEAAVGGKLNPYTAAVPPKIATATVMNPTTFPAAPSVQDRRQWHYSRPSPTLSFPTFTESTKNTSSSSSSFSGTTAFNSSSTVPARSFPNTNSLQRGFRRTAPSTTYPSYVDMVDDTEVETETEGDTENDESASEDEQSGGNHRSNNSTLNSGLAGGRATSSKMDWSNNSEQDWVALIDQELKNARTGEADPHALRKLLRKAGFVPPSRRKDVWRLLILGRVEAGLGGGKVRGAASTTDILALEAAIWSTDLDLDNQRVVRVDVERTRPALEQFKRPRVKHMLARVLTHHCKTAGVGYKQVNGDVKRYASDVSSVKLPVTLKSRVLCFTPAGRLSLLQGL